MPPPKQLSQYMQALAKLRENGAQGIYLKVKEAQTDIRNLAVAQIGTGTIPASAAQLLPSEVNGYVALKIRDDLEALMTSTFRLTDVAYGSGRMASGDWDRLLAQSAYREQRIVTTQRARIQVMLNQHARGDFGIPNSQKARAKVRAEVEKLTGGDWRARRIARTETAITTNHAQLNNLTKNGYTTVRIFDGSECHMGPGHNNGEPASGRIVDLETANMYPISHPNCIRAFEPNRTKEEKAGTTAPPSSGLGPPLPPRAIPAQPTPVQPQPLSAAALQEQSLAAGINPSSVATLTPDELAAMRGAGITDKALDDIALLLDDFSSSGFVRGLNGLSDIDDVFDMQRRLNDVDGAIVKALKKVGSGGIRERLEIAGKANRKLLDDALQADDWAPSIREKSLLTRAVKDNRYRELVTVNRDAFRSSRRFANIADDADAAFIQRELTDLVDTTGREYNSRGFATTMGRAELDSIAPKVEARLSAKAPDLAGQWIPPNERSQLIRKTISELDVTDAADRTLLRDILADYKAQIGKLHRAETDRMSNFVDEIPSAWMTNVWNDVRGVYANRTAFRSVNQIDYGTYRYAVTDDYKKIGTKLRDSGGDINALSAHEKNVLNTINRNHEILDSEIRGSARYRGFGVSDDVYNQLDYRPGRVIEIDTPTSFSENPSTARGFSIGEGDVQVVLEVSIQSGDAGNRLQCCRIRDAYRARLQADYRRGARRDRGIRRSR